MDDLEQACFSPQSEPLQPAISKKNPILIICISHARYVQKISNRDFVLGKNRSQTDKIWPILNKF